MVCLAAAVRLTGRGGRGPVAEASSVAHACWDVNHHTCIFCVYQLTTFLGPVFGLFLCAWLLNVLPSV